MLHRKGRINLEGKGVMIVSSSSLGGEEMYRLSPEQVDDLVSEVN